MNEAFGIMQDGGLFTNDDVINLCNVLCITHALSLCVLCARVVCASLAVRGMRTLCLQYTCVACAEHTRCAMRALCCIPERVCVLMTSSLGKRGRGQRRGNKTGAAGGAV